MLIASLASCNKESVSLKECGEKIIPLMAEMLVSDAYKELYDFSLTDAHNEVIEIICKGDYSKASQVYELLIPEEILISEVAKGDYSEELYNYLYLSQSSSLATFINRHSGNEALIVSSIFSAQKIFANGNIDEIKTYLYVFENGNPILMIFTPGEDGAFRANGHFIINDNFVTDNESAIVKSCEDAGVRGVTAIKNKINQLVCVVPLRTLRNEINPLRDL